MLFSWLTPYFNFEQTDQIQYSNDASFLKPGDGNRRE